ncbi:MAG: ionic transporter y4hA [Gammaproteobacteria bacterium]|nr:ionic transporter y4hA [Gammaproteobacteria bacterium]
MKLTANLPWWSLAAPALACMLLAGGHFGLPALPSWLLAGVLVGCVVAAVHHAEVVAHRVGEPFGTLLLAVAVTVIEVALIVSMMVSADGRAAALARDTVFAAVMIILNGIVGLCLLMGGSRFREQTFQVQGVNAALTTLAAIVVLTLVLPNYTQTVPGPVYSQSQLAFIAVVSVALYGIFVLVQTVRHREYFLASDAGLVHHLDRPSPRMSALSGLLLLVALGAVVLLAKALAPALELAVANAGAPHALVGVVIALFVLLPEGLAAVHAARLNRLQTSLNLALGSALATIALTIPAVAMVSLFNGWSLELGIDGKSTVLLVLSLGVAAMSLATGRTTIMQGAVHLVIFAVYLFTTIVP